MGKAPGTAPEMDGEQSTTRRCAVRNGQVTRRRWCLKNDWTIPRFPLAKNEGRRQKTEQPYHSP